MRYRIPAARSRRSTSEWLNAPSDAHYVHATAPVYDTARAAVVGFWQKRLDGGAQFDVPETPVQAAERGILTQLISYGWRYSIGNDYEELSYAESLDAAEVAAEYGYPDVSKQIIEFSLERMRIRPWRFTAFRGAQILSAAATYYRLTRDRSFLRAETPALDGLVRRIASPPDHERPDARPPAEGAALHRPRGSLRRQRLRARSRRAGAARDRPRLELGRVHRASRTRPHARSRASTRQCARRSRGPRSACATARSSSRPCSAEDSAVRPDHRLA